MSVRATMNVPDFAAEMGISRTHAYALVKRGEIESIRLGQRVVIPRRVLDELLARRDRRDQ